MGGPQEIQKGGRKGLNVDLNLVPFIDLMSVCVTFLLMTAVWTQTGRLSVDQSVSKGRPTDVDEPPKRLTVRIDRDGFAVKFADAQVEQVPAVAGRYDLEGLVRKLGDLRDGSGRKVATDQRVVIAPDDQVAYGDLVGTMDACAQAGLHNVTVADADSVQREML